MIPREYIKVGNWFKTKGSDLATFDIWKIDGEDVYYNNHFINLACSMDIGDVAVGCPECVGYMEKIDKIIESDRWEPQGDARTFYDDYKIELPSMSASKPLESNPMKDIMAADAILERILK